jgi:phosphoenolpyruvate carboxykinase (GTP)
MSVAREEAAKEARSHEELFDNFFDRLPKEFIHERELFKSRIWRSPEVWELARPIF